MRDSDPRAREILERTESLSEEELHAPPRRDPRASVGGRDEAAVSRPAPAIVRHPWEELERPAPDCVTVGGVEVRRGSRVRLRPRAGRDVSTALDGKSAIVEGIDQDYEGRSTSRSRSTTTPGATSARSASPAIASSSPSTRSSRWPRRPGAPPARRACSWPGSATSSWATTASASRSPPGFASVASARRRRRGLRHPRHGPCLRPAGRLRRRGAGRRRAARRRSRDGLPDRGRHGGRRGARARHARDGPGQGPAPRARARWRPASGSWSWGASRRRS